MQNQPCTATGDLEVVTFESKVFPAPRKLRILLPAGYRSQEAQGLRYRAVYLNDGQNLFDRCTAPQAGEWGVDETVQAMIRNGRIPPVIVVGIDHGGRRLRPKEYLPYVDDTLSPPELDPQGRQYPRFLLDEVIPFVEQRYRVLPGPANRVLGGSSYGAGAALYTVVHRPGSFRGILIESPSIYSSDYQLLKDAAAVKEWPAHVYVGTGTVNEPVEDVRKLEALLRAAGLGKGRLRVVVQEGAAHAEKWWGGRLGDALEFLLQ